MKTLIIGGSRFQGPHLIKHLLELDHDVTLFNRGSKVQKKGPWRIINGDRRSHVDLKKLSGYIFDTVIDTCAYQHQDIKNLSGTIKTRHYCMLSSAFVYPPKPYLHKENDKLFTHKDSSNLPSATLEYALNKILCEKEALRLFGKDCLIFRPSMIIGESDHTGRLSFWISVFKKFNIDLSDYSDDELLQLVDVIDLAKFISSLCHSQTTGIFNVGGLPIARKNLFDIIQNQIESNQQNELFLKINSPPENREKLPFFGSWDNNICDISAAKKNGFEQKSVEKTVKRIVKNQIAKEFNTHDSKNQERWFLNLINQWR